MKNEAKVAESNALDETTSLEPPGKRTQSLTQFNVSQNSAHFFAKYFPQSTMQEWNDWKWQVRNSFTSLKELSRIIGLASSESGIDRSMMNLPIRITPYYASLLDPENPDQPLRKTMVPVVQELILSRGEEEDPLGEENTSPTPFIVHRYPDRALFLTTGFCSAYCRYCTRSHMVAKDGKKVPKQQDWEAGIDYIRNHPEIRDVILSGGDPLTLSDARLEYLLSNLRKIPHLEIIRIGTKVPVVLPQRITPELVKMLKKYHPLFMSIHFTHPEELTVEVQQACNRLADAGIPLGSQTVLLRGVNDDPVVFKNLMHGLLKIRVRPYYLYQCDPIPGSAHFRTPVQTGIDLIKSLRGFTSGYAIPNFVIDAPGGGGKIPLIPEYREGYDQEGNLILRNYQNKEYKYPDYL